MNFAALPSGAAVFLDANTFVYNAQPHPLLGPPCQQLLQRIAQQDLAGYTSAHVLTDVAHRVMTLEAIGRFQWPVAGVGRRLKQRPADLQQLSQFRQAIEEIKNNGIQILPITNDLVLQAAILSQQHGLLSGDALIVAVMQAQRLTSLASHDADFDRIPGLVRFGPL